MPADAHEFPRHVHPLVVEALADTRIVLVMGARQVGKSTMTEQIAVEDHPSQAFTLDDKTTRDAAIGDPTAFVAGLSGPALIDEVQRAPDLPSPAAPTGSSAASRSRFGSTRATP